MSSIMVSPFIPFVSVCVSVHVLRAPERLGAPFVMFTSQAHSCRRPCVCLCPFVCVLLCVCPSWPSTVLSDVLCGARHAAKGGWAGSTSLSAQASKSKQSWFECWVSLGCGWPLHAVNCMAFEMAWQRFLQDCTWQQLSACPV